MEVKSDRNHQSMNPRRIYPDGIIPGWVNPVYGRTWEPKGSLFPGPSDERRTFAQPAWGYDDERARYRHGFAEDITGQPYTSTEPEWSEGNQGLISFSQRNRGRIDAHNPSPMSMNDPATHSGQLAAQQQPGPGAAMANKKWQSINGLTKLGMVGGLAMGGYQLLKRLAP